MDSFSIGWNQAYYGIPLPKDIPPGATITLCGHMTATDSNVIGTDRLYTAVGTFDCAGISANTTGPPVTRLDETFTTGSQIGSPAAFDQVFCFNTSFDVGSPLISCTDYLLIGFAQYTAGAPLPAAWSVGGNLRCTWSLHVYIP